jgi:predicted phosphodiesterase
MGDGGLLDDFRRNGEFFRTILDGYYLEKKFKLILNGDIEDLQKFPYQSIKERWAEIYDLFDRFERDTGLLKTVGNHDAPLFKKGSNGKLRRGIRLQFKGNDIFVFHGHQALRLYEKHNYLSGFIVRYLLKTFRIKNKTAAYDSEKRFKVERRVYDFSSKHKLVSIIGHTHRPLFESMSKINYLKFNIERMVRKYPTADDTEKNRIEIKVREFKTELERIYAKGKHLQSSIYNISIAIPCLFNSGCVIGKRGMTAIEIADEQISLVHWFDSKRSNRYLQHIENQPERFGDTDYYRVLLNTDFLTYVFSKIKLLA